MHIFIHAKYFNWCSKCIYTVHTRSYGTAIRDHTLIDQHTNYLITLPVCTDKSFKYKLIIRIINKTTTHPLLSVYLFSVHILLYKQTNIYKPVCCCLHVLHITYCMH